MVAKFFSVLLCLFALRAFAGGDYETPSNDLRTCTWLIAMSPTLAQDDDIQAMKRLLARRDVSVLLKWNFPGGVPGEVVTAKFLPQAYADTYLAQKNLNEIVETLKALKAKGLEVSCDVGTGDPRLGTGS